MKRNTKTKNLVAEIFQKSPLPLTLSEVFDVTYKELPDTAYSTVYRIVQTMIDNKKINSLDYKDRGGRFEWAQREHHHHLICNSCGEVKDLDDDILNFKSGRVSDKTGFKIDRHSIELTGICEKCQKNAK